MNVNTLRDVRLVRQREQIELQRDVLFERLRHANRRVRHDDARRRLLLRLLDPLLDLADVVEIVVQPGFVLRRRDPLQVFDVLAEPSRGCSCRSASAPAAARRAGAAEEPLEGDARIDLHRQRLSLARPRQRVHVGAGVLRVAAADVAGEVLGRELD